MQPDTSVVRELTLAAFDTLPINAAIVDEEGTIVWTDRAWQAFAEDNGLETSADTVGVNYFDAIAADDEDAVAAVAGLERILAGETDEFTLEYPCHSPDEKRWFLMWAAPFDRNGERFATVAHFDITDRRLAELEAKETADALSQERDHLALLNQVVRHDIRNDVQLIDIYAERLADTVDDEGREDVDRIKRQTSHIVDLTEIVRDLSAVITDESDLSLRPMSLGAVLQAEIDKIQSAYGTADTPITVTADDLSFDLRVMANEMLSSVFGNILSNAVVHNDADDVRIAVDVERRPETAVVSIADNGPGIPPENREGVFGRGEKGLESPGAGLGLYLVDTLVDVYGGDVGITDSDLGGATFHVELRLAH